MTGSKKGRAEAAWLRPALVGWLALMVTAAFVDQRTGTTLVMAGSSKPAERQPIQLSTDELIREMLTHD